MRRARNRSEILSATTCLWELSRDEHFNAIRVVIVLQVVHQNELLNPHSQAKYCASRTSTPGTQLNCRCLRHGKIEKINCAFAQSVCRVCARERENWLHVLHRILFNKSSFSRQNQWYVSTEHFIFWFSLWTYWLDIMVRFQHAYKYKIDASYSHAERYRNHDIQRNVTMLFHVSKASRHWCKQTRMQH